LNPAGRCTMNRNLCDGFVGGCARGILALAAWACCFHSVHAQSVPASVPMRRLPPLTALGDTSQQRLTALSPLAAPVAASSPLATSRKTASPDAIQLTSAVTEWSGVDAPRVRRLPPLTAVAPDVTSKPMRRPMPAHIGFQPPGSRPADGVARVLPGSTAVGHRTIILGPPPQPADATSDLANVGRATLRTPGLKPKMLPSPISQSPAH
jgi:hypothetical protein